jgi:hypothetical protein
MSDRQEPQLEALIGRALIDRSFRDRLVADVRGTLAAEHIVLGEATVAAIEEVARDPARLHSFSERFDGEFLKRAEYVT